MSEEFLKSFAESNLDEIIHLYELDVQDDFLIDDVGLELDLPGLPLRNEVSNEFKTDLITDTSQILDKELNTTGPFNDIVCFTGDDLDSIDVKSFSPKLDLEEYYDDEWIDLKENGQLMIRCNHCNQDYSSRKDFLLHAGKCFKKDIVEYTCCTCNHIFTRFSNFRKHSLRHNPEKYKCLYCDAEFNVQSGLVSHISLLHSSIYPYVCSECGLLCPNESVFSLHQKKFHPNNKGYSCKICNKVIFSKKNLVRHVRVQHSGKIYMCEACGKLFLYKLDLMRHLAYIHSEIKPYPCDLCPKRFPDETILKKHRKIHLSERTFVCTICTKSFKTRAELNSHSFIHDFTKRFSCSKCNKGFNKSSKLKEHENTHTGEKPFLCKFCPSSFTNGANLLKHTRRVHKKPEQNETKPNHSNPLGKLTNVSFVFVINQPLGILNTPSNNSGV